MAEQDAVFETYTYKPCVAGKVDAVFGLINSPPPGEYRRATYTHTSPWELRSARYHPNIGQKLFRRTTTRYLKDYKALTNAQWVCDDYIKHGADAETVYPPCSLDLGGEVTPSEMRLRTVLSVGNLQARNHGFVSQTARTTQATCHIIEYGFPAEFGRDHRVAEYAVDPDGGSMPNTQSHNVRLPSQGFWLGHSRRYGPGGNTGRVGFVRI